MMLPLYTTSTASEETEARKSSLSSTCHENCQVPINYATFLQKIPGLPVYQKYIIQLAHHQNSLGALLNLYANTCGPIPGNKPDLSMHNL